MARRLAPASRWGLGSRSEPGLWLAPGLWSESGLLPGRRLEPEWMRTSGPGPRRLGMNSSPGRNRPIGPSGRRRARNTVVSTWQWCYSSDWAVSHQSDNTDARSVIFRVATAQERRSRPTPAQLPGSGAAGAPPGTSTRPAASGRLARLGLSFQHVNLSLQLGDDGQQGLPAGGSQVKNGIHTSDLT